jgi:uncharacterized protein YbjQ (UPF0145 family)
VAVLLVGIVGIVRCPSFVSAEEKKIVWTTVDLKQDYEILDVITSLRTVTPGMFSDPMEGEFNKACKNLEDQAKKLNADAIIGFRVEIQNITKDTAGRVLVYGTAVKFK